MLRNKEEVYNTWSKMQFLRLQTPDIKWESNVKCSTQDFISVKSGFNFVFSSLFYMFTISSVDKNIYMCQRRVNRATSPWGPSYELYTEIFDM